jgi:hypothetical protein
MWSLNSAAPLGDRCKGYQPIDAGKLSLGLSGSRHGLTVGSST